MISLLWNRKLCGDPISEVGFFGGVTRDLFRNNIRFQNWTKIERTAAHTFPCRHVDVPRNCLTLKLVPYMYVRMRVWEDLPPHHDAPHSETFSLGEKWKMPSRVRKTFRTLCDASDILSGPHFGSLSIPNYVSTAGKGATSSISSWISNTHKWK